MHASDLEPLNIFERYAFALGCIERLCDTWGVRDDPFVAEMIAVHWTLVGQRPLIGLRPDGTRYNWWVETLRYFPKPSELEARLRAGSLSADQLHALHHAVYELRTIPSRDMHCKPESHRSAVHTLNVVGVLLRWGVAPPPASRFCVEGHRPGTFGYGTRPYTRADFLGRGEETAEPGAAPDPARM